LFDNPYIQKTTPQGVFNPFQLARFLIANRLAMSYIINNEKI